MKKKKQQRKRGIAEEIQVSILSKVVIVFVIVAAVVTFMVGNISLSAQKNRPGDAIQSSSIPFGDIL